MSLRNGAHLTWCLYLMMTGQLLTCMMFAWVNCPVFVIGLWSDVEKLKKTTAKPQPKRTNCSCLEKHVRTLDSVLQGF